MCVGISKSKTVIWETIKWQQDQQQQNQGQTPPHTPRKRGNGNRGSMMPLVDASAAPRSFGSFTIELKVPGQE